MTTTDTQETDMNGDLFCWHYRTIRHVDSTDPTEPPYFTVHEFSFDKGKDYDGFSFTTTSPRSKEEALAMAKAFDYPPVIEVDENDYEADVTAFGTFDSYRKYTWLDKKVPA
jgi:hypothetical protein